MRIGSLFSGYGGLDLAVQRVYGGEVVWYSEIDKHACTVLAARHPSVPNLGDITAVDWATVPAIDILTGGYPCQPFSHAGQRKGTNDERHLWPYVRDAIVTLCPMVTVLENVDGHRSLGLDVVLGDLADLGLSARWGVVRAADAGAPHGRKRVFIVVTDADGGGWCENVIQPRDDREAEGQGQPGIADGHSADGPVANAAGAGLQGSGRLLPALSGRGIGPELGRPGDWGDAAADATDWGKYATAITRWESVLGRPAPSPTIPGANGRPRLSPYLVEWMMGLEPGHVTGHGLKPAACLKMLGNGVVPQQAELALRMLAVTQ